jgi:hypothetical protein
MADRDRVEARNVSMYPDEWEAVDQAAARLGFLTSRGPNTSLMLRQIVRGWRELLTGDQMAEIRADEVVIEH